jgi:hypothetical protein
LDLSVLIGLSLVSEFSTVLTMGRKAFADQS